MPNLDYFIACDPESGTYFAAANAVVLDTRWLSDEETDVLNNGSDRDRSVLFNLYGSQICDLVSPDQIEAPASEPDYGNKGDFSSSWLGR